MMKQTTNYQKTPPISIVNIKGGLGNQMFQYAFWLFLHINKIHKEKFYINIEFYSNYPCHNGFELERIFGIDKRSILSNNIIKKIHNISSEYIKFIVEAEIPHLEIPHSKSLITIYDGYWQKENYIKDFSSKLRQIFKFPVYCLNSESAILSNEIRKNNAVSIHIRRGDYIANYNNRYLYNNICTLKYYEKAIMKIKDAIGNDLKFYLFTDDPDWVKKNINIQNSILIFHNNGKDSWQDMYLISQCKYHIISNSTFSWWGAWLSDYKNKIVIAPDPWTNGESGTDIIPNEWIRIKMKNWDEYIEMRDVTFLIPVRIDSDERRRNLDTLLYYLNTFLDTNIIILEADSSPKYILSEKHTNTSYLFIKDNDPVFHRTFYINKMLDKANTAIVGIWDTDVIISVEQIKQAVEQIRQNKAVMSYPYDGHFYTVSSEISACFRKEKKISLLKKTIGYHNMPLRGYSVGGAFFVDKELYMKGGGENEFFYGWGGEDRERIKRLEILGYPVYRVYGPLFHLYHPISQNSCFTSEEQEIKSLTELLKICGMTKEGLVNYISTWKNRSYESK